jgi:hypothetical protein
MSNDEQMHHVPEKNKREKEKIEPLELKNTYRDNLKIDALRAELDTIKVDLTNFVGALLQSGVVELVKDEEGNIIYKINKVVLVDESVQQD